MIQQSAFSVIEPPSRTVPFVFASPHSGVLLPDTMKVASCLSREELRRAEDCYVDELFAAMPDLGAPLLTASYSRTCVDLNRSAGELDPDMFAPRLKTRGLDITDKVKGGLGVIPRVIAAGQPIYRTPLPADEAAWRIEHIHKPYHTALDDLLVWSRKRFGKAILIDCHSMPSAPASPRKLRRRLSAGSSPDIVIGDRWGTTADRALVNDLVDLFRDAGFEVARNKPYAGGWCTRNYGDPPRGYHAIQIEISRALYMNERTFEKKSGFGDLQQTLNSIMSQLIVSTWSEDALAAE